MNFIAPAALGFLGLLPLIVFLYFLKLKRREELISSTFLWKRAHEDLRVNSPFQRLRRNLLLWLQLALLALMVFALARPARDAATDTGRRYICLIDTSASMSAKDVPPSRMEKARSEALRLVGDMTARDQMMLMTFDARPRVLAPFTSVRSRLREEINGIRATEASTDFAQAAELAQAMARDLPQVHLYVISDGVFDTSALAGEFNGTLHYVKVGTSSSNAGITAMDARRSVQDWEAPQVFVRAQNFSALSSEKLLELYLDGNLLDARRLEMGPGQSAAAVFSDPRLAHGLARAKLTPRDDLDADNEAQLALVEPRKVRTLVVTGGNFFLRLAIQRDPFTEPVFMDGALFDAALSSGKFLPGDYDLVIFDRHRPASLPPGAYLFFDALPPIERFVSTGEADRPMVIDWDSTHPINQHVNYSNMFIEKSLKVAPPSDAHTLVDSDAGPLVIWWQSAQYRIVTVAFDIFASRWPLRVGFPVCLANAVRHLGGQGISNEGSNARPGSIISFAAPAGVEAARVTPPGGVSQRVAAQSGRITFADTYACGPYVFDLGENRRQTYVVNLLDAAESNIAPRETLKWEKTTVTAAAKALKENREFWFWPALAALAFLMLEWYIYNRRVYV
jgi:hypothetical protein